MKKNISIPLVHRRPMFFGLFLFASLLTLFLLIPQTAATGGHGSGCPYASHESSEGCPHAAEMKGAGCPCMAAAKESGYPHKAAVKGTGCPYMREAKGCLHALKHSLELDQEQKGKVQEIQGKFLEDSADLKKSIREQAAELDRLFRDPAASKNELTAKRKSLSDLKEQLESMAMDFRLEIRGQLTDEQLRQIPEGCWHGILAHGHGKPGFHHGCKCPYKAAHPDASA